MLDGHNCVFLLKIYLFIVERYHNALLQVSSYN